MVHGNNTVINQIGGCRHLVITGLIKRIIKHRINRNSEIYVRAKLIHESLHAVRYVQAADTIAKALFTVFIRSRVAGRPTIRDNPIYREFI